MYTICSSSKINPDTIAIAISCLPMKNNKLGLFSAFILDAAKSMQADPQKKLYVQAKAFLSALKTPTALATPVILDLFRLS